MLVTGVLPHGSISADGIITTKSGVPLKTRRFAVAGGTGSFGGAQGTVNGDLRLELRRLDYRPAISA